MGASPRLKFERKITEVEKQIDKLLEQSENDEFDVADELRQLQKKLRSLKQSTYQNLTPMEQVQMARHHKRPYTLDYIQRIFEGWIELHGDRKFRDDEAIVGGWAKLAESSVMVIGHQKGRNMKENLRRNFGMCHPEGYRKALRLMRLAEKFNRPVITFIDTPGAYPGIGSEERGISEAIAYNLREMSNLRTPLISVVIGEGGSGGALGIGVTDRILMLEHSVYSVISPEGCAAILWRDAAYKKEAAKALKLTSKDILELKIADEVIPEPIGGAHSDWDSTSKNVRQSIQRHLVELCATDIDELLSNRWVKYESIGKWRENTSNQGGDLET
ncbi:MAG: acetyl-CoA carboxylase carboxyl transferase subunit alpha [Gemmatimonadetes bacterium]|nr:acetyl-CoA carboxylase carboxyl transferase subunit alpha [Gemmatimonadota bacterium]